MMCKHKDLHVIVYSEYIYYVDIYAQSQHAPIPYICVCRQSTYPTATGFVRNIIVPMPIYSIQPIQLANVYYSNGFTVSTTI